MKSHIHWSYTLTPEVFLPKRCYLGYNGSDIIHIHLNGSPREKNRVKTAAINSLAFSPNGRFLASGSDDQTVRIWDYPGKQERSCLKPHQGKIQRVAFSPDGHRLMTGAVHCVRSWQVETLIKEII